MRPDVLRYDDRDLNASLARFDDATEGDRLVGYYKSTWRAVGAAHFERGVLYQPFGRKPTGRSWIFTRSRGYHVIGPSRCGSRDTSAFPPELRGVSSPR